MASLSKVWAGVAAAGSSKENDGTTSWEPGAQREVDDNKGSDAALSVMSKSFFRKWPGVLGSSKWKTPDYVISAVAETIAATLSDGDVFADLGCGDGRVIAAVAARCPGVRCMGYEINPDVARQAEETMNATGAVSVEIICKSAYTADFTTMSAVYIYSNRRGLYQLRPLLERLRPPENKLLILYMTDLAPPRSLPGAVRSVVWCQDANNALNKTPVYIYAWK